VERSVRRSGALIDYLARHLRRRSESALAPLGLRTRHLVALTVLRERLGVEPPETSILGAGFW
jgi:hypothetical protein